MSKTRLEFEDPCSFMHAVASLADSKDNQTPKQKMLGVPFPVSAGMVLHN
jgi:hypothetical protein